MTSRVAGCLQSSAQSNEVYVYRKNSLLLVFFIPKILVSTWESLVLYYFIQSNDIIIYRLNRGRSVPLLYKTHLQQDSCPFRQSLNRDMLGSPRINCWFHFPFFCFYKLFSSSIKVIIALGASFTGLLLRIPYSLLDIRPDIQPQRHHHQQQVGYHGKPQIVRIILNNALHQRINPPRSQP